VDFTRFILHNLAMQASQLADLGHDAQQLRVAHIYLST
jgi:hypothetical protein